MRSRLPLISALLALALLLGQVLVAAHDSDHGLQPGAAHCVVCVYAHSAGTGALPAIPVVAVADVIEQPDAILAKAFATVTVRLHPIRGPPAVLA
jgi:hypothetical protein